MFDPLAERHLYVQGQPVLSMAEIQSYVYGLPEDAVPPPMITHWIAGEHLEASELLKCFRSDILGAAASSDESLEIARLAVERLEALLPEAMDSPPDREAKT